MSAIQTFDDEIDFSAYIKMTEPKTRVKEARAYRDDLIKSLTHRADEKTWGLPWPSVDKNFRLRTGEVSIWAGQNGHGKTQVMTQVALGLMEQGAKVCIASFELKPVRTLKRMSRMFCGMNPYSPEFQNDDGISSLLALYDAFFQESDGKLWLYDKTGTAEMDMTIGMVRYAASELKVDHIIVDNLAKVVASEDDYNQQKAFIDEMTAIARDNNTHIHIVHHLKKPPNETDKPDKHHVKGTGAITDLVDNLWLTWRNKPKEDDIRANGSNAKKAGDPDQLLMCKKQRNYEGDGDDEPMIRLWFSRDSGTYQEQGQNQRKHF